MQNKNNKFDLSNMFGNMMNQTNKKEKLSDEQIKEMEDFYNKVVQMDATHSRNSDTQGTFFSAGILSAEHKFLLLGYMWNYDNEKAATLNYFMD